MGVALVRNGRRGSGAAFARQMAAAGFDMVLVGAGRVVGCRRRTAAADTGNSGRRAERGSDHRRRDRRGSSGCCGRVDLLVKAGGFGAARGFLNGPKLDEELAMLRLHWRGGVAAYPVLLCPKKGNDRAGTGVGYQRPPVALRSVSRGGRHSSRRCGSSRSVTVCRRESAVPAARDGVCPGWIRT